MYTNILRSKKIVLRNFFDVYMLSFPLGYDEYIYGERFVRIVFIAIMYVLSLHVLVCTCMHTTYM